MPSNFIPADKATRFSNHVIDTIGFLFIIFMHAMILDEKLGLVPNEGSPWLGIYFIVLYVLYFTLFEYFWGKTPGKFFSKTHVITISGERPTILNLIGRTFSRFIPFDSLSFLFSERGWHDQVSKTSVVYDIN